MATDVKTYKMFVNGKWVDSSSGNARTIVSPATGEVLAEVPEGTAEDVDSAVAAAKTAFEGPGTTRRPASGRPRC